MQIHYSMHNLSLFRIYQGCHSFIHLHLSNILIVFLKIWMIFHVKNIAIKDCIQAWLRFYCKLGGATLVSH